MSHITETGITTNDIEEYFKTVKYNNLSLYTTEDLYTVLKDGLYKELPLTVLHALNKCLTEYREVGNGIINDPVNKDREVGNYVIYFNYRDRGDTSYQNYFFKTIAGLPVLNLETRVYEEFYEHFTRELVRNYVSSDFIGVGMLSSHKPMTWYTITVKPIREGVSYYVGDGGKRIVDEFKEYFIQELIKSDLGKSYTEEKLSHVINSIRTW